MSAPIPAGGLEVAPSTVGVQIKAQVRILLAVFAGMMLGRLVDAQILPAALANDGMSELIVGVALYLLSAGWQWARARLQHMRLLALATDVRVPSSLVRTKP